MCNALSVSYSAWLECKVCTRGRRQDMTENEVEERMMPSWICFVGHAEGQGLFCSQWELVREELRRRLTSSDSCTRQLTSSSFASVWGGLVGRDRKTSTNLIIILIIVIKLFHFFLPHQSSIQPIILTFFPSVLSRNSLESVILIVKSTVFMLGKHKWAL